MKMYYNYKWMIFSFLMAILYEITSENKSILGLYSRNKFNFSSSYGENNRNYSILHENTISLRPASSYISRFRRDIRYKVNRNEEKGQTAIKNGEMASKLKDRDSEESKKNGRENNNDKSQISSSNKNKLDSIYKYLKSLLNVKEVNDKENLKFGPRSIPKVDEENKPNAKEIRKKNVLIMQNYKQQSPSAMERKVKDPMDKASLPQNFENTVKISDKSSKILSKFVKYRDDRLLNKYLMKERRYLQNKTSQNHAKTITKRYHTMLRKENYKSLENHIRIASKNSNQQRENEVGNNNLIEQVKTTTPVKFILLFMVLCVSIVIITVLFNCPLIYKALSGGNYDHNNNAKQPLISINEEKPPRKRLFPSKTRHRNVKDFHWNVKKSTKSKSDSSENESNTSERSQILETKLLNGVKKIPNSNEENIKIDKQNIKVSSSDHWENIEMTMDQKDNVVELCALLSPKTSKNNENIVKIEEGDILDEKNIEVIHKYGQYLSELRNVLDVANKQLGKEFVDSTDENNYETKIQSKTNFSNNCNVWKCEPHLLKSNFLDNAQSKDETTTTDEEQVTTSNPKRQITKLSQIRKILQNSVNSDNTTNTSKQFLNPHSMIDVLEEFQTDYSFSDPLIIHDEYKDGVFNDTNDNSETETSSSSIFIRKEKQKRKKSYRGEFRHKCKEAYF
ncbi:uncharacterized protein LOC111635023 isoform X2 [Centruroides sculpturatus]|uniref:uncharacterized protein LOC111635023 isoform X1 n=1 Tax=Centruroides sculpturatus TaxID=218467 RepID=UPI000C6D1B8B|nr:uncharacterized protein LOC111635023 isoform X1 [Centruroides sculpturatus]XP_023235759.1 uncharacterized protein LOC111635023 isoform X2 [Centruroides sculpturatus]